MKEYPKDWDLIIDRFADVMRSKIAMVAHKGDWRDVPNESLCNYMKGEVKELDNAINSGNPMEVTLEAADVALCAMMLFDKAMGCPRPNLMEKLIDEGTHMGAIIKRYETGETRANIESDDHATG